MRQGMKEMYEDSEPTKFDMDCKPGYYYIARYIHMIFKIVMHANFVFLILPFTRFEENWFRARVMAVDR